MQFDVQMCIRDRVLDSAGVLSELQASLGSGDAALGTHDGSALFLVQPEVDQGSSLGNVLAGLGDSQTLSLIHILISALVIFLVWNAVM